MLNVELLQHEHKIHYQNIISNFHTSTNPDKQGHLQILFLSPDHIAMEPTPIICCYC